MIYTHIALVQTVVEMLCVQPRKLMVICSVYIFLLKTQRLQMTTLWTAAVIMAKYYHKGL